MGTPQATRGVAWGEGDDLTTDAGGGGTTLTRDVALGVAPEEPEFKVLDGGAGVGDILYLSMELSTDAWDWVEISRAP